VASNDHNLDRADIGPAPRSTVQSTIRAACAAAALAASVTGADASAREIIASSYGFADSLLTNKSLDRPPTLPSFVGAGAHSCFVDCGPAFGTFVVRQSEVLASNTADSSETKTLDAAGHQMGVSGMTVVESLETDSSGLSSWVVVSESTVDQNGSHSWSLLSAFRGRHPGYWETSTVSRALRFPSTT
jgi:hypothetical protein